MEEIGIKGLTSGNVSGKLERREKSCRKVLKMPENKLNDEKVLQMFVDRLIADKGGDTLDAKQKETLQGELMSELDERMQQAMIRALPDAKLMELEKMLDADASDEEIESFFANASKDAGVDFDPEIRKVFEAFRTDYFKDKIKVSVKTSVLAPVASTSAGATATTPSVTTAQAPAVAPGAMPMPGAGQPTQGTTSAVPGQSNVEGVANTGAVSAVPVQASAPVETPVQVAASSPAAPVAEPVASLAGQQSATAQQLAAVQPVQPVAAAQPVQSTAVQSAQPAAAEEKPLQAAPNLMDALNTATANLNAAAANMGANSGTGANLDMAGNNMTENLGAGNAGAQVMGEINNTDLTGKEA